MVMSTSTRMDTTATAADDACSAAVLLQLMWLASPALPVGGFSYSEGLEAAVEAGRVTDSAAAGRWLLDQLHLGLGRSDLPAMLAAFDAWRRDDTVRVEALNAWVLATRESGELAQQTRQTGRSLGAWLAPRLAGDARLARLMALQGAPSWPIAYALAAESSGATARDAGLAFTFCWAENMVQAAIKAVPLGQSAGQRILGQLAAAIPGVVESALEIHDAARQAHAPMLAILCAQHESQYSRLFRS
jgi:urease accessory protein